MRSNALHLHAAALAILSATSLAGCADGPRIEARPQGITFAAAPTPALNQATVAVTATASSGLPVRYGSKSPAVCSVDAASGAVTATVSGTCTISADQRGDAHFDAAQQVTQDVVFTFSGVIAFSAPSPMEVFDLATAAATESSGLPVHYASETPSVCSVDVAAGLITAVGAGDCTIVASAGDAQASRTFTVSTSPGATAPGAPSGVVATAGSGAGSVLIRIGAVRAGGSPITGYTVTSSPPGVTTTSAAQPIPVTCPSSCAGLRFAVSVTTAVGSGPPSGLASVVTTYDVVVTFHEPDTRPNDSIFVGTFTYDASAGAVSGLRGRLSESMTGGPVPYPNDTMTWLPLSHQLSSEPVTLDGAPGWLITSFLLGTTDTLSANPLWGGTDGWAPGSGGGLHSGYPGPNPGNAYVRIFVAAADPTAALTQAQLDRLAYADCAPGGMMGATCMTGTTVAGYGTLGTMGGRPGSQATTRR